MITRRTALSSVAVTGATLALGQPAWAGAPAATPIVFVHGLFADGSCWLDVIGLLQQRGYRAISVQNPLTGFAESVDALRRVLDRLTSPCVLVGHSFGGMLITQAGSHPMVRELVYVAARAPDAGEDYGALAKRFPPAPATAGIVYDGDEGQLSEQAFVQDFANGLPRHRAEALYAVQQPFRRALVSATVTAAAWHDRPASYAIATQDRTINPDLQRFMARRMGARTIEVPSGHLAMIVRPDLIAGLVHDAATRAAPR